MHDQAAVYLTTNSAGFIYAAYLANITPGDVNADGFITNVDVYEIFNAILGTRTLTPLQILAADVNHDGHVDILDVIQILDMIN